MCPSIDVVDSVGRALKLVKPISRDQARLKHQRAQTPRTLRARELGCKIHEARGVEYAELQSRTREALVEVTVQGLLPLRLKSAVD
jgi:hypothetical protein